MYLYIFSVGFVVFAVCRDALVYIKNIYCMRCSDIRLSLAQWQVYNENVRESARQQIVYCLVVCCFCTLLKNENKLSI